MRQWIFLPVALLVVLGCAQSQKDMEASPVERGVASADAPTDFDPNREHFSGSFASLIRELKLMRGVLERDKVLGISTEREHLLTQNLFDTGVDQGRLNCQKTMAMGRKDFVLHHRTADGTCYMHNQGQFMQGKPEADISYLDHMGSKGARFGRNTAPITPDEAKKAEDNILNPNPVELSKVFLSRQTAISPQTDGFQPVPWVNLLATAWLQAENHDWFSHGKNVDTSHLPPELKAQFGKAFQPYEIDGFTIPRTQPDMSALRGELPGQKFEKNLPPKALEGADRLYARKYRNAVTHWWDASHIYGSDEQTIRTVRTIPNGVTHTDSTGKVFNAGEIYPDGKIAVDEKKRKLYYRPDPQNDGELLPITGFHDNWWIGLDVIHTVFALEHNKVIDVLKKEFETPGRRGKIYSAYNALKNDPVQRGDFLFQKARLVVSALIAKIHTVEWTPAILDNPGLRMGMFANWNGIKTAIGDPNSSPVRKGIDDILGTKRRALISGLTGPGTLNLYKVPFSLTEEFVSVYRMHPLLSDKIDVIKSSSPGKDMIVKSVPVDSTRDGDVEQLFSKDGITAADWMYSFGRNRAGLMTLHNYPKFMDNMEIRRNIQGQKKNKPLQMNMGAVDIVRDRERQTPRYNAFRRALRMRPLSRFEELFITSKVLYEDEGQRSPDYRKVIGTLRSQASKLGFDVPMIQRDIEKIPDFNPLTATKQLVTGGVQGLLKDGKKLISEDGFYSLYFALPEVDQKALLTQQEINDIQEMKRLYKNDVEQLDLLIGTLAEEDRFDRFGFGNTPFYIFALMASRRLMTDPFLSDLYIEDVYSKVGLEWVEKQTMISVITRNFPELAPRFKNVKNAFHPWNPN